jgi:hypothetical protein
LYLFSDDPTKLLALLNIFLDGGAQEGIEFLNRLWKWLGDWLRDRFGLGRSDRSSRGGWSWRCCDGSVGRRSSGGIGRKLSRSSDILEARGSSFKPGDVISMGGG